MADTAIVTILAILHVVSAMAWLGAATLFVSIVAPGLRLLSPMARLEFLAKVAPKVTRFFIGVATATVVFGLALFLASDVSDIPLYVGALLGLVAYAVALGVTVPAFHKADRIANQALANPQGGPPSPELGAVMKRAGMGATLVVVLVVVAAVLMVVSGFAF